MRALLFMAAGLIPFGMDLRSWQDGYFTGYEDASIMMSETIRMIEDKELDTGIVLDAPTYKRLVRQCIGHMRDARDNPRVKKLMKEIYKNE